MQTLERFKPSGCAMKTILDMSSYEIEQDEMEIKYAEEIISAGRNPSIELICEQLLQHPTDEQIIMATDITALNLMDEVFWGGDSEMLPRNMHSYPLTSATLFQSAQIVVSPTYSNLSKHHETFY